MPINLMRNIFKGKNRKIFLSLFYVITGISVKGIFTNDRILERTIIDMFN